MAETYRDYQYWIRADTTLRQSAGLMRLLLLEGPIQLPSEKKRLKKYIWKK